MDCFASLAMTRMDFAGALRVDLLRAQAQLRAAACDKSTRRANHFRFSEIESSPGIKNIPLSVSPKSVA
jgi:hypothetical protein